MPHFKSLIAAMFATLAVVACASPSAQVEASPTELETRLVDALLEAAEWRGPVSKVFLAPNLPPGVKSAAAELRPAVTAKSEEIVGLAKGQLLVQSATLEPSRATLSARLGSVAQPQPNMALFDCGTGFTVTFNLVAGQWQQGDLQILQC